MTMVIDNWEAVGGKNGGCFMLSAMNLYRSFIGQRRLQKQMNELR